MTAFSLCVHLRLDANSTLALSLPQSRLCILWARQLPPQREPRRLPPQSTRFSVAVKVRRKRYHRSPIQPLSHRWFLIKGIKALVCPFAVLRSRFGLRYSCVRGRRQSKFLAASATGGARNFYPMGSPADFNIPDTLDRLRRFAPVEVVISMPRRSRDITFRGAKNITYQERM